MRARSVYALVGLAIAGVLGACATSGGSLSSMRYNAEDLAAVQYETTYDFLRAHNRVRVGQVGDAVPIRVRRMGSTSLGMEPGEGGGGGGGDEGAPTPGSGSNPETNPGGGLGSAQGGGESGRYVAARLYIDDREVGNPIPRLRQLRPAQIKELEILRPSQASSRYGGAGDVGVVSIILKEGEG